MPSTEQSSFNAWDAYERVRAWAEDHACFCSHRSYRGPAGLAGALLGLLERRPECAAFTDTELTVAAIHAYYGEDRRWWQSTYIERRYDEARVAGVGLDDTWRHAYLREDDPRRQMRPWWRAATIVEEAHVQLLCAGVDLQHEAFGACASATEKVQFSVAALLHHGFGAERSRWPGPYRNFPGNRALEADAARPRLLHGSYQWPSGIVEARELGEYLVFPRSHALVNEATGELESPEDIW